MYWLDPYCAIFVLLYRYIYLFKWIVWSSRLLLPFWASIAVIKTVHYQNPNKIKITTTMQCTKVLKKKNPAPYNHLTRFTYILVNNQGFKTFWNASTVETTRQVWQQRGHSSWGMLSDTASKKWLRVFWSDGRNRNGQRQVLLQIATPRAILVTTSILNYTWKTTGSHCFHGAPGLYGHVMMYDVLKIACASTD